MYEHFVNSYNLIFPFDESLKKGLLPFIKEGGKAVDLGCGTGRLVHLLTELGMDSSGVDLDKAMIEKAKKDFPALSFYHENMVDFLSDDQVYDLILCFGNTLVHLNPEQMKQFLKRIKQRLAPNGYFIIQLLNYDKILKFKPEQLKTIHFENGKFTRHYTYYENTISFKTKLAFGEMVSEGETTLYPYTRSKLKSFFNHAELEFSFVTNLDDEKDDINSDHLTVIVTH